MNNLNIILLHGWLLNSHIWVDFKALLSVNTPVSLADIRADKRLSDIPLLRQTRLSVLPVQDNHWEKAESEKRRQSPG